jgi:DNA phosphorothioation-dependent restriction protein DptG
MIPDDLISELRKLFQARHYREALDLTSRSLPQVRSMMTAEHSVRIAEMMHVAQMAIDLEEWDAASGRAGTKGEPRSVPELAPGAGTGM